MDKGQWVMEGWWWKWKQGVTRIKGGSMRNSTAGVPQHPNTPHPRDSSLPSVCPCNPSFLEKSHCLLTQTTKYSGLVKRVNAAMQGGVQWIVHLSCALTEALRAAKVGSSATSGLSCPLDSFFLCECAHHNFIPHTTVQTPGSQTPSS